VVVFTAWHKFKNISKFQPRIAHHVAYTKLHGYKYVIFVAVDMTAHEKALLGRDVEVILVPGFAERRDVQKDRKPLQTGWLKIEGFKVLHTLSTSTRGGGGKPSLFFYLERDVFFHNFKVSLTSVFVDKPQSIFVQDKQADRMFSPSHAVAIRNTPEGLSFRSASMGLSTSFIPFHPPQTRASASPLDLRGLIAARSLPQRTVPSRVYAHCATHPASDAATSKRHRSEGETQSDRRETGERKEERLTSSCRSMSRCSASHLA
jgi:hypothetical protein